MIDKDLKTIADYFKFDSQKDKLVEETGEMLQALIKFIKCKKYENRMHLDEEIADVKICLEQIEYLISVDFEVQEVKQEKINRTLQRIENGYYKPSK